MGELPFKIFRHISFCFLFSLFLSVQGCIGGGSDLGGAGAGGSPITQNPPSGPGGGGGGGFTPPPLTTIGGVQGAAPPMESGALGPMTDYSLAVLVVNCGNSSCKMPVQLPGQPQDDSSGECEYTYKVKGVLRLSHPAVPMPDRVLRVLDRDTGKFWDVLTGPDGGFEITVTVDETPHVEFWATDLSLRSAVLDSWEACAGSCIAAHYLKIPFSSDGSCSFLTSPTPTLMRTPSHLQDL